MLWPGYTPPDRKALSGRLLDWVFDTLSDGVAEELDSKEVTLVQDGWSDSHNQPEIVSCIHTGKKSYFVTAEDKHIQQKECQHRTMWSRYYTAHLPSSSASTERIF